MRRILSALLTVLITPQLSSACPLQANLIDFNCDGIQKIALVGDSFTQGVGDVQRPNGGYFVRLTEAIPEATVVRYAVPGVTTARLLSLLKRRVPDMASGPAENNLIDSDVLIIDVGRNDFYSENSPPTTVKNIKRIVSYLSSALAARGNRIPPVIAVASLLPTKRTFQRFFITYVNDLMSEQRSNSLPVFLRFDKLSKTYVSSDGLHPNSAGYTKMAQVIRNYLSGKGTQRASALRPDQDGDGVYDLFETTIFGTSTSSSDTDSDGFTDYEELFGSHTDPRDAGSHP